MKCKFCGNEIFQGHQLVRMYVTTDGDGEFIGNVSEKADSDIYDSEAPYGPFICSVCGAQYEELKEGTAPDCDPEEFSPAPPFKLGLSKTTDDGGMFRRYEGACYNVHLRTYKDSSYLYLHVRKTSGEPLLPELYIREDESNDPIPVEVVVGTVSYGSLSLDKVQKLADCLKEAAKTASDIDLFFVRPIRDHWTVSGVIQELVNRKETKGDSLYNGLLTEDLMTWLNIQTEGKLLDLGVLNEAIRDPDARPEQLAGLTVEELKTFRALRFGR